MQLNKLRRLLLTLACVASCGDPVPDGFGTDHVVVKPTDSEVVCRGTLDDLETQVLRVAAALDVDVPHPITVHYGPSAVEKYCGDFEVSVGGCAKGLRDETYIAGGGLSSLYHELVHAVRRANGMRGPSFFEEGIAVVLGGFRPFPFSVSADAKDLPPAEGPAALAAFPEHNIPSEYYGIAAHFTAWLIATYSQETVAAFLNDPRLADATGEAFTAHFGKNLADAELDWRATSEREYIFGEICDPARALAWSGDVLQYTAELACEAENVLGPSVDRITLRSACFSVEAPGTMRVELLASSGEITLRSGDDCLAVGPLSLEHYQEKRLIAGETIDAAFAPCTWEVIISTDLATPTDFTLRLSR